MTTLSLDGRLVYNGVDTGGRVVFNNTTTNGNVVITPTDPVGAKALGFYVEYFSEPWDYLGLIGSNTEERLPVDRVNVRTFHGTAWQASEDAGSDPRKISSVAGVQARMAEYAAAGIEAHFHCIPNLSVGTLAEEIALAKSVIAVTGQMDFAVETSFYAGNPQRVHQYMGAIRSEYPQAELGIYFSASPQANTDYHFNSWVQCCDKVIIVAYWYEDVFLPYGTGTRWVNTADWVAGLKEDAEAYGKGIEWIVGVYTEHNPVRWWQAVERILGYGQRISVWRRGAWDLQLVTLAHRLLADYTVVTDPLYKLKNHGSAVSTGAQKPPPGAGRRTFP